MRISAESAVLAKSSSGRVVTPQFKAAGQGCLHDCLHGEEASGTRSMLRCRGALCAHLWGGAVSFCVYTPLTCTWQSSLTLPQSDGGKRSLKQPYACLLHHTDDAARGVPRRSLLQPHHPICGHHAKQDALCAALRALLARLPPHDDGRQRRRHLCVEQHRLWLHAVPAGGAG